MSNNPGRHDSASQGSFGRMFPWFQSLASGTPATPPEQNSSNNLGPHNPSGQSTSYQPVPFFAAEYQGRKTTIRRNSNYHATVASIKKAFTELQLIPADRILLSSRFDGFDDLIQVTEDMWAELVPRLMVVNVLLEIPVAPVSSRNRKTRTPAKTSTGKTAEQRLVYTGTPREDWRTLSHDCAHLMGKPVIYLFPTMDSSNIRVRLSLINPWEFSALYPPTATSFTTLGNQAMCQTVDWTVDAKPDGSLFDRGTQREVSYLFWEAHDKPQLLPSPTSSRFASPDCTASESAFNPSNPVLSPSNAALLSLEKVTAYIDDALIALGLHTEARTSFITYWLPDLSKHKHIALRFLPQGEYEA
ncbi:hypothetical protein BDV93DRAFT_607059, partial [Ceratobasidium sp. AG-I]